MKTWKEGMAIGLRLIIFSLLLSFILLPVKFLENWLSGYEQGYLSIVVSVIYCCVVLPLLLPGMFAACGLTISSLAEDSTQGGNSEHREDEA